MSERGENAITRPFFILILNKCFLYPLVCVSDSRNKAGSEERARSRDRLFLLFVGKERANAWGAQFEAHEIALVLYEY